MALSEMAAQFAAQIREHPWAEIPDLPEDGDPEFIRLNAMWVTAQVLGRSDPNFDVYEYSQACGCTGRSRKFIESGVRYIAPFPPKDSFHDTAP
jgi:hypothetical protein